MAYYHCFIVCKTRSLFTTRLCAVSDHKLEKVSCHTFVAPESLNAGSGRVSDLVIMEGGF